MIRLPTLKFTVPDSARDSGAAEQVGAWLRVALFGVGKPHTHMMLLLFLKLRRVEAGRHEVWASLRHQDRAIIWDLHGR